MTKHEGMYKNLISKPEVSFWIPLIIPLLGLAVAWGVFTTRVEAISASQVNINSQLDKTQVLLERIIVLEEKDKALQEDITEIKADVKYIRQQINK